MNEKALHTLSYGLFILGTRQGEKDNGCIINTAIQGSSTPLKITICVNRENLSADTVSKSGKFTLSVLGESTPFSVFERFGFQSGRDTDKWGDFSEKVRSENGIYYYKKAAAYFACRVTDTVDLGSHLLFVGEVENCEVLAKEPAMTYAYYFANVKPKPVEKKGTWVCKICGYVYDEEKEGVPFEALPDTWVCPLCKHPKSDFLRQ